VTRLLKFAGSLAAALLLAWLTAEPGFTQAQGYVLFLLFFAIGLWFTEAVPPFSVGILILAYLASFVVMRSWNGSSSRESWTSSGVVVSWNVLS